MGHPPQELGCFSSVQFHLAFNQLLGRRDSYSALVGAGVPDPFEGIVERLRFDFNGDDFEGTYRFAGLVAF